MKFKDAKDILIDNIMIEDRQRNILGDIDTLALSIETYTLMEPIIVQDMGNNKYRLLDGERRIRAMQKLKRERIAARLYDNLDKVGQQRVELELNIRRKAFTPVEEARAIRRIYEEEKKKYEHKLPGRFGRGFSQADLATMLDKSQPQISKALKIAEAADTDQSLEMCDSAREVLRKIDEDGTTTLRGSVISRQLEESLVVDDPYAYLSGVSRNYIDLLILDVDKIKSGMFEEIFPKLRTGGSIIIFHPMIMASNLSSLALKSGLFAEVSPYIWHCGKEDTYITYSWFGKNREHPLRFMPFHGTHVRKNDVLHSKAKPATLISLLVKHNTEAGASVIIAPCFDIESVKVCIESKRTVIGVCPNKILREKALIQELDN